MNFKNRSIGFFISFLNRQAHRYYEQQFAKYDLNRGSLFILRLLYNEDGLNQSKICSRLVIDKSNVTRNIAKLEKMNYVQLTQDKNDSRAKLVFLSEKAKAFREEFDRIFISWHEIILEKFSVEDEQNLKKYLNIMGENVLGYFDKGNEIDEK